MSPRARAAAFCAGHGLDAPILRAPMPGTPAAVAQAAGFGSLGTVLLQPETLGAWAAA
jgi:hypothetical protein